LGIGVGIGIGVGVGVARIVSRTEVDILNFHYICVLVCLLLLRITFFLNKGKGFMRWVG
jgi:cell division protein FtsW (lipid II flippase)